jgi:hypothetical protein
MKRSFRAAVSADGLLLVAAAFWLALLLLLPWDPAEKVYHHGLPPLPGYSVPEAIPAMLPACVSLLLVGIACMRRSHVGVLRLRHVAVPGILISMVRFIQLYRMPYPRGAHSMNSYLTFLALVFAGYIAVRGVRTNCSPKRLLLIHLLLVFLPVLMFLVALTTGSYDLGMMAGPLMVVAYVPLIAGVSYVFPCMIYDNMRRMNDFRSLRFLIADCILVAFVFFVVMISP